MLGFMRFSKLYEDKVLHIKLSGERASASALSEHAHTDLRRKHLIRENTLR